MMEWDVKQLREKIQTTISENHSDQNSPISVPKVYEAICQILMELIEKDWSRTNQKYDETKPKQVFYFSMEFLLGRLLQSYLLNYQLLNTCNQAIKELGFDPEEIYYCEQDPGLGNGGLGRLAACFLDSTASLSYPGHGYGIRFRYGLFEQRIINGYQTELPDYWLKDRYPWEIRRADEAVTIQLAGHCYLKEREDGSLICLYENQEKIMAVPYDIPIVGYDNQTINTLRLWSAEPIADIEEQEEDQYYHQLEQEHSSWQISGFLYPDDSHYEGKQLRLKQQYFLVSASLQDILRKYSSISSATLPKKLVIQINDTHPSLAIPELLRILLDEKRLEWEDAWEITRKIFAYTNHTLMSEALETWPVDMFRELLPRIYMLIEEINERFCQDIWLNQPHLRQKIPSLAIIADHQIHMARLAVVGSFSVNGVAKIHSEILKTREMKDFYHLYPKRFNNKTNGISHRRWLVMVNPRLTHLISDTIGTSWVRHPRELTHLLRYTKDTFFLEQLHSIKQENKRNLAAIIHQRTGILVDDQSIFDVQIKRMHEYKRQLLNVFHILYLYNELKQNPKLDITPRTFIFAAKAAPNYYFAKEVIKLIHTVASIVNYDHTIHGKLKVVFLENYNVSLAEKIIPATDLSEQISTAGKEASGTGNMKMMMNGALTIGTLDGANIEMKNVVQKENMFIFGLKADEVYHIYQNNDYFANEVYQNDERLVRILHQLRDGLFGHQECKNIYYHLLSTNDPFFILKDFSDYVETQQLVDHSYAEKQRWLAKSLINIAHSGKFSSDQTIQEYATGIWKLRKG